MPARQISRRRQFGTRDSALVTDRSAAGALDHAPSSRHCVGRGPQIVTARASTPITATATNQVSHSTPSKPNNRPSRQICADMTRSLASKPLHQGYSGKHVLVRRSELRGHPPPISHTPEGIQLGVSYVTTAGIQCRKSRGLGSEPDTNP